MLVAVIQYSQQWNSRRRSLGSARTSAHPPRRCVFEDALQEAGIAVGGKYAQNLYRSVLAL
jgi:hypothetical protein